MSNSKNTSTDKENDRAAYLFIGVCVLIGLSVGYFGLLGSWLEYRKVQSWKEVPAKILNSELAKSKYRNKTVYRLDVEYEYELQGEKHIGSRANFMDSVKSLYDVYDQQNRELTKYVKKGEPFRCFVNPAAPEEAVLYRTLYWDQLEPHLVFTILPLLIGGGLFSPR